jgi:hypothetical protein
MGPLEKASLTIGTKRGKLNAYFITSVADSILIQLEPEKGEVLNLHQGCEGDQKNLKVLAVRS